MTGPSRKHPFTTTAGIRQRIHIEFDGGTPCNIPRLGYGNGYGSFIIVDGGTRQPIRRLEFGQPMSANVAEISTLIAALRCVAKNYNPENTFLEIHGDSKIALSRCSKPLKMKRTYDSMFAEAVTLLQQELKSFAGFETRWRGRAKSVELFGH
jgi:ribonuclease HI